MTALVQVVLGAVAVALGTWYGAWWAPALWGAIVGAAWARARPARWAALAAALGWALLLVVPWLQGHPVGTLARGLSASLGLPTWGFVLATPLFAALLAGSAARAASLLRRDRAGGHT